jgi:hypothetical protein
VKKQTKEKRRFHGEFYTPEIWVDEGHRMIEQQFCPNWKDEYVIWDPAYGTGNLTKGKGEEEEDKVVVVAALAV